MSSAGPWLQQLSQRLLLAGSRAFRRPYRSTHHALKGTRRSLVPRRYRQQRQSPLRQSVGRVSPRVRSSRGKAAGSGFWPFCRVSDGADALLRTAITRLALSARAYHRILKIARTIADLAGAASLESRHVSEAIQYRSLDRRGLA